MSSFVRSVIFLSWGLRRKKRSIWGSFDDLSRRSELPLKKLKKSCKKVLTKVKERCIIKKLAQERAAQYLEN